MAWFYLIAAGLFEIGWPVGLKPSQTPGRLVIGVIIDVAYYGWHNGISLSAPRMQFGRG